MSMKSPLKASFLPLLKKAIALYDRLPPPLQRLLQTSGSFMHQLLRCAVQVSLSRYKAAKYIEGIPRIEGDAVDGRRDMQMALHGNFQFHREILDVFAEHGAVVQTFWRGQPVILVNDPRLVEQIFLEAKDKIQLNMKLDTSLHRAKYDPAMKNLVVSFVPSFTRFQEKWRDVLLNRLQAVLDAHVEARTIANMTDVFGSCALDFVYLTLFDLDEDFMGRNLHVFVKLRKSAEFVFDNMEQALPDRSSDFASWLDFFLDLPVLSLERLQQRGEDWEFLQELCRNLLKKLREKHERGSPHPFFSSFLEYAKTRKLSEEDMVRELAIFVLAGHETTANAMSWMLFEMVRNDGVQEKCREVVHAPKDSVVPGVNEPDGYLLRVIKEVLRIDSVVSRPMLRTLPEPTKEGDRQFISLQLSNGQTVNVPPGVGFAIYPYALHNSPANWENPTHFDPDRFLTSVNTDGRYVPFSFGLRRCPGESLALKEMQMVLEVLTKYHFSFVNEEMLTQDRRELQRSSITMRPAEDLRMRVTKPAAPIAPIKN